MGAQAVILRGLACRKKKNWSHQGVLWDSTKANGSVTGGRPRELTDGKVVQEGRRYSKLCTKTTGKTVGKNARCMWTIERGAT